MNQTVLFDACQGLVSELSRLYEGWSGAKQFQGTPLRLSRMYEEYCWSPARIEEELGKQFKSFDEGYDEMLVTQPITVWVLCPHHLLPCELKVTIGYIPNGKVLGLSKFVRVAVTMGKRPIMQEQYSRELVACLNEHLEPKGAAVYVVGRHGCMVSRGVLQDVSVVTSVITGAFEASSTREEFLASARLSGR